MPVPLHPRRERTRGFNQADDLARALDAELFDVRQQVDLGDQRARDLAQAESTLSGALGRLLMVSENYPQLKADATMRSLMEELASTENRIAFSRQAYNDSVLDYNTSREVFPNVFVANSFGFLPAEFFKIENEAEKAAPTVKF